MPRSESVPLRLLVLFLIQKLFQDVKQLFPSKRFSFIAHSYGCLVVLEMAALLEKEGYLGDIILIDGAPDITARYIEATLGTENGTEFEVKILEAMMSFVLPGDKMVKIVVRKYIF